MMSSGLSHSKKAALALSVTVLALVLAGCAADSPAVQPMPSLATKNRTILFVWDGMRPDSINATDTPNLYAMKQAGAYFSDNHSTYPTFTMMNAASLATGAFPGTTGFYGNTLWQAGPTGPNASGAAVDFNQPVFTEDYKILDDLNAYYDKQLFLVGTLFKAAQKAGMVTAVIGKSGPAYIQDVSRGGYVLEENMAFPLSLTRELSDHGYALPGNTAKVYASGQFTLGEGGEIPARPARVNASFANGAVAGDPTDASGAAATAYNQAMMKAYLNYILPVKKPDLSLIWFRDPDTTEHNYGPGTANYHLALRAQDARLGELQAKLRELGIDRTTNLIVVSDHGHSTVSGPVNLFPLRAVAGHAVGAVDPQGYSASGDVRTAHLLSLAGFAHVYDGTGCFSSGLSGQKADGTFVYPMHIDTDGSVCGGAPGASYQTPSYKVPSTIPENAIVVAANGGSDYLYVKNHDPVLVRRLVHYLQSREQYGAVFVAKKYVGIPGTLTMDNIKIENTAGRNPDIIVSFTWDDQQKVAGLPGIEFESFSQNRGMHGSFGPTDVHNTLLAIGPDFKKTFNDDLPTGNVDVAPTIAQILGVALPQADGRPLYEALAGSGVAKTAYALRNQTVASTKAAGLTFVLPTSLDNTDVDVNLPEKTYKVSLQTKVLSFRGRDYTYFDYAKAVRQ